MLLLLLLSQFDSLSLDQVIDLAITQSPNYYESKASLDQSRLLFYQSIANLLPTINASADYNMNRSLFTSKYTGSIGLAIPIFDLDVVSSIIVADRNLASNRIQHTANVSNLVLSLKTSYYNLVYTQDLMRASDVAVASAEENLKLVEAKYKLGSASRLEMLQGEVFHLRTLQDQASARTMEINAQEELKALLGIKNDIIPIDTLALPGDVIFPSLDSLILILRKTNYNIRVAQEMRNVAKLELVSSYLAFLPKVSFFYNYNVSTDSVIFDFQYYQDIASRNYGIRFSLPIFDIKNRIFDCLNAKKELQLKELSKLRTILETEKSLRTTYAAMQEAYNKLIFARKGLDAAEEAVTIAREQYAVGAISLLDFLSVETDLYDAKVSYTSAISDFYIKRANFSYLVGGLAFDKE